jgi:hypothetical protein
MATRKQLPGARTRSNGAVLYEGPSLIDGEPIVAIVTGITRASDNEKTGDMLQTWILRSDIAPVDAVRAGADKSICGGCPHRGSRARKRSCYVQVGQAPRQVWEAYMRGNYPHLSGWHSKIAALGKDRAVRLGAYGDPAAVPVQIWQWLVQNARTYTGYTHQWRSKRLAGNELRALCQASVDTPKDFIRAREAGWGTFRVLRSQDSLAAREVHCPADKGNTTCAQCGLCNGARAIAVAIPAHGYGASNADKIGG